MKRHPLIYPNNTNNMKDLGGEQMEWLAYTPWIKEKFNIEVGLGFISVGSVKNRRPIKGEVKRAPVSKFSKNSRNNLMKIVNNLSPKPELYISLSYADKRPDDPKVWKKQLDTLTRTLRRRYPASWFIWRLEPTKHGHPHYHLLGSLNIAPEEFNLKAFTDWLRNIWERISGVKHDDPSKAVDVQEIEAGTYQRLNTYFCVAEDSRDYFNQDPLWAKAGRRWGIINKKNLPLVKTTQYSIDSVLYAKIKNHLNDYYSKRPEKKEFAEKLEDQGDFFVADDPRLIEEITRLIEAHQSTSESPGVQT